MTSHFTVGDEYVVLDAIGGLRHTSAPEVSRTRLQGMDTQPPLREEIVEKAPDTGMANLEAPA
jgi:hypothetical protein